MAGKKRKAANELSNNPNTRRERLRVENLPPQAKEYEDRKRAQKIKITRRQKKIMDAAGFSSLSEIEQKHRLEKVVDDIKSESGDNWHEALKAKLHNNIGSTEESESEEDGAGMTESSPLLRMLPPELIANITHDPVLSLEDVQNIRLSCKGLNHWATQKLASERLSRICVSFTRKDLEVLRAICTHPGFGPHVKSVQFDHTRIHPDEIQERAAALSKASDEDDYASYSRAKEYLHACTRRYADESEMDESEETVSMITRSFAALKAHGCSISLVSADPCDTYLGIQHQRLTKLNWCPSTYSRIARLSFTLDVLLKAAYQSGVDVNGLQISSLGSNNLISIREAVLPVEEFEIIQSIYTHLENIYIDFDKIYIETPLRLIKQLLAAPSQLKTFHLNLQADPEIEGCVSAGAIEFCNELLDSVASGSLTEISVWNFGVSQKNLLRLLKRNARTLDCLTISCCALLEGSWPNTLTWLRQNAPELRYLRLRNLYTLKGACDCGQGTAARVHFKTDWEEVFTGRQGIQAGLQKLLGDWKRS